MRDRVSVRRTIARQAEVRPSALGIDSDLYWQREHFQLLGIVPKHEFYCISVCIVMHQFPQDVGGVEVD